MHGRIIQLSLNINEKHTIDFEERPTEYADYWGEEIIPTSKELKLALNQLDNIAYDEEKMILKVGTKEKFWHRLKNKLHDIFNIDDIESKNWRYYQTIKDIVNNGECETIFFVDGRYATYNELQIEYSNTTFHIIAMYDYHY